MSLIGQKDGPDKGKGGSKHDGMTRPSDSELQRPWTHAAALAARVRVSRFVSSESGSRNIRP